MSVFSYTAMSRDGRKTGGTLSADSRAGAVAAIAKLGLSPIRIDEAKSAAQAARKAASAGGARKKVPAKAVESFTRELANLLAGGVPLARALALLKRETSNPAAKQLWTDITDDVMGGMALGDAMAKHPRTFSHVYVAMVRAGETGGFLDVVLAQITDFRTKEKDLRGKVTAAMVYPAILGCLAVGVLIFLLTFFIPRFSVMFAQFGGDLPILTKGIIAASNVLKNYGLWVAGAVIIVVVMVKRFISTDAGKRKLEVIMLGTPVLGTVIAHFALVRFARMLGTLVGAGVSLVASLKVAREAIGNQVLSDAVSHGIEQVQRGEPLSKALGNTPRLFPPSVIEMIAVAEETARLDKELMRMASTYEGDLDRQLRLLVSVVEPAMLFMMAALIGTVVIGMLMPIFNLSDLIK